VRSPLGSIGFKVCGRRLVRLDFGPGEDEARDVRERLEAYFAGDLEALDAIEVAPSGTPFQQRVWAELRRIPAGETRSYASVARAIGRPGAVRAVASANARNPIALVVPCHRSVRSDGTLGGYAGGLDRKSWLLAHEGARVASPSGA